MKILAIDTATEACSAALYTDGEVISQYQVAPREHSRLILNMADQILAHAQCDLSSLDALAFGRGPGSFMGIRIATGVIQGIAFARDLPVVPVSDLLAIAQVAYSETGDSNILSAIDARMREVYWAAWQRDEEGNWKNIVEESVCAPDTVILPDSASWTGAGTGWGSYASEITKTTSAGNLSVKRYLPECLPSAAAIAQIAVKELEQGHTVTAAQAQPVYLRNDVAQKPRKKTFAAHLNLAK